MLLALLVHIAIACILSLKSEAEPLQLAEIGQGMNITLDRNTYQNMLKKQQEIKQQTFIKKEVPKPIQVKKNKVVKKAIPQKVKPIPKTKVPVYQVQAVEKEVPVKAEAAEVIEDMKTEKIAAETSVQAMQQAPINAAQQSAEGISAAENQKPLNINDKATKRYLAKLMRHLQRYKQYPALLKKNHVEGKPVVRFSINKSGQVTKLEVKRHTQYAELDQAAMEVFRRASPLPKIPSELERETLTMSLPIEYSLIND